MSYYLNVAGFFRYVSSYDADADAYFSAAGITDSTQKNAWNTFVLAAKANGYWSKLLAVYPFLGGSASTHSYNAKNPAQFQITWNVSITHNANGATVSGGTGSIGNTNFNCKTSGGSGWSSNSASFGGYIRAGYGQYAGINNHSYGFITKYDTTLIYWGTGGAGELTSSAADTGLLSVSMNVDTMSLYHNSSLVSAITDISINIPANDNMYISGGQNTGLNVCFSYAGTGLTSTDIANLSSNVQTLQTSLGRQV